MSAHQPTPNEPTGAPVSTRHGQTARRLIVVMGVSGSGKTTVGAELAAALALPFVEGDLLHPQRNIDKMSRGVPLSDEDRRPWLESIGGVLRHVERGIVVSCSALRKSYRDHLRANAAGPVAFLYLDGDRDTVSARMTGRAEHFMKQSMLDSQLSTLEPPVDEPLVSTQPLNQPVSRIVRATIEWLNVNTGA